MNPNQINKKFNKIAYFGILAEGHIYPYKRILNSVNSKYGLDIYIPEKSPIYDYFSSINIIYLNELTNKNLDSKIGEERNLFSFILDNFKHGTYVQAIEEMWRNEQYKPDLILGDVLSFLSVFLAQRNNIPFYILDSIFPWEDNEKIESLQPAFVWLKSEFKDVYEKAKTEGLKIIKNLEKSLNLPLPIYNELDFPCITNDGRGIDLEELTISLLSNKYPRVSTKKYKFIGPVFRDSNEDDKYNFDFDNISFIDKKTIFISLGTFFNDNIDFFNKCISYLKNINKRLNTVVLIAITHKPTIEKLKTQNEYLEKEFIFINEKWNQIQVLEKASLFISHCGHGGYEETMWKGCPILAYPQGGDQFVIAKEIKRLGFGEILEKDFNEEILLNSIKKILYDSKSYKENIEKAGKTWINPEESLNNYMDLFDKHLQNN